LTTDTPTQTAETIAHHVGGELIGRPDAPLSGVSDFDEAQAGQLTLIGTQRFANRWPRCRASAALVKRGLDCPAVRDKAVILVDDADLAFSKALTLYAPPPVHTDPGIHGTASIHETATLGQDVRVGPGCLIGPGVRIGDGCILHNRVTVLDHTRIGKGCTLWTGVVVRDRCTIGDRCTIHPNAVIGADGFGYRPEQTQAGPRLVKTPQVGTVTLGDDVEIGAGACIDRAKCNATVLGDGCKIDNLVQIGHNCRLGRMVIISGCTGVGGSTTIGEGTVIGGHVAITDHAVIGPGAQLAGGSQVAGDLPGGAAYAGSPARPIRETIREVTALRRLPDLLKQLRRR
jgi:UDP-3-O-[3-hydroxymyristoyl] glucosamine N-acyltransferase